MRTRVKICGITRSEDALAAARWGADAIGLVFYQPSPRFVEAETAARIVASLPAFVSVVALFVNPSEREVHQVLERVPVAALQFHGDEPPEACEIFARPYIKAVRVREDTALETIARRYPRASALLLDAHREGLWGGTGQTFDWSLIPERIAQPVVLAGGLEPGNVAAAVRAVRPFAVDVSGGVESAPGIKDEECIRSFIEEVGRGRED